MGRIEGPPPPPPHLHDHAPHPVGLLRAGCERLGSCRAGIEWLRKCGVRRAVPGPLTRVSDAIRADPSRMLDLHLARHQKRADFQVGCRV